MAARNRVAYEVFLDAAEIGVQRRVGTLWRPLARTDAPAAFAYDADWLASPDAFMLDPRLALWRGEQHPPAHVPAFGVFMDSAPDRWGRVLMERREAMAARREGRRVRPLHEMDFLLGVHDRARVGALRLRQADANPNPFLDNSPHAAPPVTELRELAHIGRRVEEPGVERLPQYERWLAVLVAPGSSLGGARPKANFTAEDGRLWIAKFPAHDDRYDVGGWEYVLHRLAAAAGIWVPPSRLERLGQKGRNGQKGRGYATFCVERFDRSGPPIASRRMYASAMTLLERQDGGAKADGASYLDLAEFLANHGARDCIALDLEQLFRRVLFNVAVSNRDDHLRNHGFARARSGWRLAPAFDMNPSVAKAEHVLRLDGVSAQPDMEVVFRTARLYRVSPARAAQVRDEVRAAVSGWRTQADEAGLGRAEVQRMEAAFAV